MGQRDVVDACFRAARTGVFDALVAVLDPDVELRIDAGPSRPGVSAHIVGATTVASQAMLFAHPRQLVEHVTVRGGAGVTIRVGGRPVSVAGFTVVHGRICASTASSSPSASAACSPLPDGAHHASSGS